MANKNQRDIVIDGRKITVHVLRVRDSAVVERLRLQAEATPIGDSDEMFMRTNIYPLLAACTDGDVPTVDEFLDLPLSDGNLWQETMTQLNPGLYGTTEVAKKES